MGKPRMSYRCALLIACISCAVITSIVILVGHPATHLHLSLYTPTSMVPSDTASETHSYVMAVRYQEQLTSGIRNALQLSHLFREHGSRLVEPFIAGTRLYGLLPRGHLLSTVLDFKAIARECSHINDIASFDEFLHKSTRDVILIHPVSNPNPNTVLGVGPVHSVKEKQSAQDILPCLLEQGVCQCSKEFGKYARNVEDKLNVYANHTVSMFRVRQVICFNKLKSMTVKQFLKALQLQEAEVYSYIFTLWQGTSCGSMPQMNNTSNANYAPAKAKCSGTFRARFIPESPPRGVCGKRTVDHSFVSTKFLAPHLKEFAANFASSQRSGTGTKVSIHLRTEWLTLRSKKIECCQTVIVDTLKMIVKTYHADNVLFVTDLGPFGSKSCSQECRMRGKQLIQSVEDGTGLKPTHFDPASYSVELGGDIPPLVENAALSDAEVLVLIGGGKFQSSILTSALLSSTLKHVYSVCSPSTLLDLPDRVVLHSNDTCSNQHDILN